jgi:hypothetical protein
MDVEFFLKARSPKGFTFASAETDEETLFLSGFGIWEILLDSRYVERYFLDRLDHQGRWIFLSQRTLQRAYEEGKQMGLIP